MPVFIVGLLKALVNYLNWRLIQLDQDGESEANQVVVFLALVAVVAYH